MSKKEILYRMLRFFWKDVHGSSVINYRARPPIAFNPLFPFEIAANYLQDESQWEVEQQEEKNILEKK